MRKKMKRIVSFFLSAIMLLAVTAGTVTAVGAAQKDPKTIDKHIVDFRNEAAFTVHGEVYAHAPTAAEPDPYTGGRYSFSTDKQAMRVEYSASERQTPIRLMVKVNRLKRLSAEYKYFVLVYAAETDKPYRLSVWNSPKAGAEAVIAENGKDTGGKWVVSDPIDISAEGSNGQSVLKRWVSNSINTVNFKTDDKDAGFYIKEMGFFKSAEDAKAYYAAADLSKPASDYSAPVSTIINVNHTVVPDDTAPVSGSEPSGAHLPKPIIMDFTSEEKFKENSLFTDHTDNTEGGYSFVTLPDGTGALSLEYSPYGNFSPYRTMPAFKWKGYLTDSYKYVRITYMTHDRLISSVTLRNNKNSEKITLVENTASSNGEWITSNPIYIGGTGFAERYRNGIHCTVEYNSASTNAEFYIKELAFFASEAQAYDYYKDSYRVESVAYSALTFGDGASGSITTGTNYGNAAVNESNGAVDITYASNTNMGLNYMAKLKFNKSELELTQDYIRVLYSAKNPTGVSDASMFVRNDKLSSDTVRVVENIADTNGKFVLSDTVRIPTDMQNRFAGKGVYSSPLHCSFVVNTAANGGVYSIKAVYFFESRAEAEKFTVPSDEHKLTVEGKDISSYRIVISEDATAKTAESAEKFASYIKEFTGAELPVVTDSSPKLGNEILIGRSNRAASTKLPDGLDPDSDKAYTYYWMTVEDGDLVISSVLAPLVEECVDTILASYLYKGIAGAPDAIDLTEKDDLLGSGTMLKYYANHPRAVNVSSPEIFTDGFDSDKGYFTEESNAQDFSIADGVIKTVTDDFALTYIHVYETNVSYKARLMYTGAGKNGGMGLMTRYNSEDAWVKAGYDFANGVWYIESRDGADFDIVRSAEAAAAVTPDTWYELDFLTDGKTASLTVNGTSVINNARLSHFSPGRIGIYAEDITLSADDVEIALLSGQGTIWKNIVHTKLPVDSYIEGGTVTEMTDGSLIYFHHSGVTFRSLDDGKTWTEEDRWILPYGYTNVLRLNDGTLMQMAKDAKHWYSQISEDDGKTWTRGGNICEVKWQGTTAGAGNMNDKITQSGTTNRIFYGQNYEAPVKLDNGRRVFCEFYYSDDNGSTWHKSETDSWEIAGNENAELFGECKLLECADGTIRMYNSWNSYNCIVYSDSTDGGKTFGPLVKMTDFASPHSSMQFVRDSYADNPTTYYMVWVDDHDGINNGSNIRSALSLAKSTDGKNWTDLGDIWRWESTYTKGSPINHVVDPFIKVTEDYLIFGSGFSDSMKKATDGGPEVHQGQRQHIYSIPKSSLEVPVPLGSFTDVDSTDPYYEAVRFVTEKGLFNGTSSTTFSPDAEMTRSMFVTVLGRLDGADVSKYTTPTFSDVAAGQWYTSYVEWAAAAGIVNGIGSGLYGINGNVTVEQVCVMLARYNGNTSSSVTSGKTVSDFADAASVSAWAADSVEWAVKNGVYTGSGSKLNPTANASRALVATMFSNYVSVYGK